MVRRVRVGCGSAWAEDRIDPAIDLVERGDLEYLALDCLAERTLVHAQLRRLADPTTGFDLRLHRLVRELALPAVHAGVRFIANMGAANPRAGARRAKELLTELGAPHAKVAAIVGDDVLDLVRAADVTLSSGQRLSTLSGEVVTANAYLGAEWIVEALSAGADVVVGGRIADPSLFLAPAIFEHGWALDDWPRLGAGQTVGHLLECGAQVTGANYADPPYRVVPELWNLGMPAADIDADGTAEIWKLPGTGGVIDVNICKAQLVYEMHDPSAYVTPDVVADVTQVTFEQVGPDRVAVRGATGSSRPQTLKVLVGVQQGYLGEGQMSYAGPGAVSRARLAAEVITKRLAHDGVPIDEMRVDYIGIDSIFGPASPPPVGEPSEVRLRVAARCPDATAAAAVAQEVEYAFLGPTGAGGVSKNVRPVLAMYFTFVDRDDVAVSVEIVE